MSRIRCIFLLVSIIINEIIRGQSFDVDMEMIRANNLEAVLAADKDMRELNKTLEKHEKRRTLAVELFHKYFNVKQANSTKSRYYKDLVRRSYATINLVERQLFERRKILTEQWRLEHWWKKGGKF